MQQFIHGGRTRAAGLLKAFTLLLSAAFAHAAFAQTVVTWLGVPATQATVGVKYFYEPATVAGYEHKVVYSISNKPAWLSFNSSNGTLSGTPAAKDVGTYSNMVITGRSGGRTGVTPKFNITVQNTKSTSGGGTSNHAPTISGTPARTDVVGAAYSFTPTASDADGSKLTFAITNRPVWASFDPTKGRLYGTPVASQVGTYGNIAITASDGKATAALPPFAIAVTAAAGGSGTGAGTGPTISGSAPTTVLAGSAYTFTPMASDPTAGVKLTFAVTNKPAWAAFNAATGQLSGTPTSSNVGTSAGIVISVNDGKATAALAAFSITVTAAAASGPTPTGAPIVLYADMIAGPVSGGENNLGGYVSIFGKNFGASASQVHVYFGATEVAAYRYFGPSMGRTDIQQITVQPGPVGSGTLPIKVVVGGIASNTDQTFMVNPGDILFVDNVSGNDSTGVKNDINHPWRTVQTPSEGGALGSAKPGDVIVLRGKATWSDVGFENHWFRFRHATGTQPTGTKGTGYINVVAYPTEAVHYVPPGGTSGGIHGVDDSYPQFSDWIVISGLHIESVASSASDGAPINLQVASDHWRIVNNELGPWPASSSQGDKAGALVGNGTDVKIFGNHIHDIGGGTENHGIYLDTKATNVEIAYNHVHNVTSGNLLQTYDNLGSGNITGLSVHHNLIHDGGRYGFNFADGTVSSHVWDNVIYNTAFAGIRFNQDARAALSEIVEHNTLYNVCTKAGGEPAAIENTWNATSGSIKLQFNIVAKASGGCAQGYSNDASDSAVGLAHNLFSGYAAPSKDANALNSAPAFVAPASFNFELQASSPAIDAATGSTVTNDFELFPRSKPDIGAMEYHQ